MAQLSKDDADAIRILTAAHEAVCEDTQMDKRVKLWVQCFNDRVTSYLASRDRRRFPKIRHARKTGSIHP